MPSTFSALDHNLPRFTGEEPLEKRVQLLQDYDYQLLENLKYIIGHLDIENLADGAVEAITDPIYRRLEDADGNINNLAVTAKGLQAQISNNAGNITQLAATADGLAAQISDANLNITSLQATAQGLASRVSDAEGNISTLTQTAQGLQTRVTSAEGSISTLTQTANGLQTRVTSAEGNISTVTQTVNGLTITANGTTMINGGSVYTNNLYVQAANVSGSLSAGSLKLDGLLPLTNGGTIYGYMGVHTGKGGPVISDSSQSIFFVTTNNAAKMSYYEEKMIWVASGGCYSSETMQVYSDRRAKNSIDYNMSRYTETYKALKPCVFKYNREGENAKFRFGFVAQDVLQAAADNGLEDGDFSLVGEYNGMYTIGYGEMPAWNTYMIQGLLDRVEALEKIVAEREG